jgi:phage terminase Nu1 subunit (DNA packaging protein)
VTRRVVPPRASREADKPRAVTPALERPLVPEEPDGGPPPALSASPTLRLTRPQAIALLGVNVRTFARLEAEGVLTATTRSRGKGSTYDGPTIVREFLAYREALIRGSNQSARDRRDLSQAALNELRLARERRDVLPRAEVVRAGQAVLTVVATKLRHLPGRLVRLGAVLPPGETIVEHEVDLIQSEIAALKTLDVLEADG